MAVTKLQHLIDPEVMAPMISAKLTNAIVATPFAKIDTTLAGQPGSTITVPKYTFVGEAGDIAEGASIGTTQMAVSSANYTVKKAAKNIALTDEAVLSGYGNPVGEANNQLALSIASKVDSDVIEALESASVGYKANAAISYNGVVNAIDLFNEEQNVEKVMFVAPAQVTTLRKDANFISADKYNNNVIMKGEIGMIANTRIVPSRKIVLVDNYTAVASPSAGSLATYYEKTAAGYVLTSDVSIVEGKTYYTKDEAKVYSCPIVELRPEDQTGDETAAVTIFLKRGVNVESDRDIDTKTTIISVDEHYVAALTDDSKVVLAKFTA